MYFTQQSLEKIYYFFWRGCVNLQIFLGGICMVKVIVFEKNGEVRLATLIDDQKEVCRENFTDIVPCPEELMKCVPSEIAEFCKETAPHYLYLNSEGNWESTREAIPV